MATSIKNMSKNLPVALVMSVAGYLAATARSQAFQPVTINDGCQVWANDQGQPLVRRQSGYRVMLKMPCGSGNGANAASHYTSHVSGGAIIVYDTSEGVIATFQWDGGTGLDRTSVRPVRSKTSSQSRGRKVSQYVPQ